MYVLVQFDLPVWFWLLFYAVTLDATSLRGGLAAILGICGIMSVSALLYGVPWHIPLLFSLITLVVFGICFARSQFIHQALLEVHRAHEELKAEVEARHRVEAELAAAQRMEAIGRLAAGVAHEINTPMQFVSDNLEFISDGAGELIEVAQRCAAPADRDASDLDYIFENLPTALAQAQLGVQRVAKIIASMKELAHPGGEVAPIDLNHAITNTLTISTYQYKMVADIETNLGPLPLIEANGGELNQVLLNLIVNAADAIEDVVGDTGKRGTIAIQSCCEDDAVVIRVRDTGGGIPDTIRPKVFEPFFTTKPVGRGTGQGLAISRAMVERHGGTLTFETEAERGTTFTIRIPAISSRATADASPKRAA
jgi:signal transduction histidine kinase